MKFFIWPLKQLSRLSFRKKITISLIIISLLMISFMGLSTIQLSSKIILDVSKRLSENNFKVVHTSLDNYFKNVENYSTLFLRMSDLRKIMQEEEYNAYLSRPDILGLDASVREIMNLAASNDKVTFNSLSIFCKNGFTYNFFQNKNFPYDDYESCIDYYIGNDLISEGYNSSTWCDLIETVNSVGRRSMSFINLRMLYDPGTFEEIGIMVVGIDEEDLRDIYSGFSKEAFIMHKNGRIISHSDSDALGMMLTNNMYWMILASNKSMDTLQYDTENTKQLVTFKKLAYNNTYFVVPFDYYSGDEILGAKSFNTTILLLIIIGIVSAVFFALLLSKGLSSSLMTLKKTVQAVYKGNLYARYESANKDEVSYLGEAFNEMLDEINKAFEKQKEQEQISKTLELKLLQSQINPHLLYNTLDSALWKIESKDISQAKALIISLSSFFKITLSGGNDLIPIQKELELINNYIDIQNTARGKKIVSNIKTVLLCLDYKIIKLTIQPIVENAIIHGFSGYRDNGTITIAISIDPGKPEIDSISGIEQITGNESPGTSEKVVEIPNEGTMQIVIEDNGIGIPEKELSEIQNILDTYPPETEIRHFGLFNIQRRIKNMFGDEYGIRLESEVGNFTRVIMNIPVIKL